MLVLWYFTWVFLMIRPFLGYIIFYLVALTLEFDPFVKKLNLAYNYWTVSTRALIFHMNITCDKTFLLKPLFLTLWSWPWSLTDFLKTLTLLITFEQWVLELIFNMSILCDKNFPWVPTVLTLWPWPLSWPICWNFKIILANNFWTVSTRALIFHMSISCAKTFPCLPCDLDLGVLPGFF